MPFQTAWLDFVAVRAELPFDPTINAAKGTAAPRVLRVHAGACPLRAVARPREPRLAAFVPTPDGGAMKKVELKPDELRVESFEPGGADDHEGTVEARAFTVGLNCPETNSLSCARAPCRCG